MAVSSPDLLVLNGGEAANGEAGGRNFTAPSGQPEGSRLAGGHVKTVFRGSVAGGGVANQRSEDDLRSAMQQGRAPPIDEESSPVDRQQPNFPDDAAFPVSESSSAAAPPHFPRRPTFGHQHTPSNLPYAMNSRARVSSLTLASDSDSDNDADEANTSGNGFYGIGRNDTMESVLEAKYSHHATQQAGPLTNRLASAPSALFRPVQERDRAISYGHESEPTSRSLLHPPNTLAVLWAFAHLEGTFEVDESLIKRAEFLEVKRLLAGGTGGVGVGGGTLEDRRTGGGWREWLGWGRGGASQGGSAGPGAGDRMAAEDPRGAASLEERKDRAIKDRSVPTLSCPPSILAVDLVLQPGQSKSFAFSIRIPADLPPSFRGKAIKFNYHLVVGSNRISLGPISLKHAVDDVRPVAKAQGKPSVSRVMRVPIRVYNHVGVTGARPFYDLTNPVIFQRDEAITADLQSKKETAVATTKLQRPDTGKDDFESYAVSLLSSVASDSPEFVQNPSLSPTLEATRSPTLMEAPPSLRPEMSSHRGGGGKAIEAFGLDADEAEGCKAAVEIVSRNSQKVSYDINKDGYQVASLTLVKSAYRLGETVNGSILLNGGEGRVLRVSARLETHELVETSISTLPAPRMRQITRRLHAEHHEMTLDAARLGFALAIPSGATPDFGTSGVKLQWSVRLSFLVIPPSPEASANATPNITPRRLAAALGAGGAGGRSSPNDGTSTPPRHGRSKSFAYGFEPAVPVTLPPPPPVPPSGAAHLMPVPPRAGEPTPVQHISYRAVPDLGYVPVLFSSAMPEPPPAPGPLQKAASGAHHRPTPSMSLARGQQSPFGNGSAVLVPAKVETVECSIPIKVYPGNTPFRPTITVFDA
ncbi:rgp1 family protein [Rhodotorula toruloides]|uniref:Rgp1 family protein n=1 Tax=Rhodotorula toruloides TaxID=5286 RepID=A0A511KJK9_RHOTO|nr:rgp1 family protein [Rhodotorula toruloides]